ncbi:MAG TPA: UbiA family prenyltransferase [Candidatus Limnocylindrales bacterium]|nr:UbiA family prenyltransferase [Candidatus Limnocylindrales bacterium]
MTVAIALIAGAGWGTGLTLGLSMTALQASIGALNDVADAATDALGRPSKPIPAGVVTPRSALALALIAAFVGLGFASLRGPTIAALGVVILVIGYAYDLGFKATRWSWLPFAVGIPLLPVFAWFGAADGLPAAFAILIPAAISAGAALALGNSLVDLDGDATAGIVTPTQAWGAARVRAASTTVLALVALVAVGTAVLGALSPLAIATVTLLGVVVVGAGRWEVAPARTVRERAWQVQAAGVGGLAAAWLGGLAAAGSLR